MKTAFLYSDRFSAFDYGQDHPLKPFRLALAFELMKQYGLFSLPHSEVVEAEAAKDEELTFFHEQEYVDLLKAANPGKMVPGGGRFGLGPGDNPVFKGMFEWSALVTGASLRAASLVDSGNAAIAFNIAGGLHHARASSASGFCYLNDPVVAIESLLRKGRRVAYIDIDAHHGDGVQEAFYKTDRVLTISIHETGMALFPGTGFVGEMGAGHGEGYSVNVPMPPMSDDELFLFAFRETVPHLIEKFRPDIVVSQLGVDSFVSDPLTHLNYTTNGFCEAVRIIKEISPAWVALGGGGYDLANVARAWTLAWAIMNNIELPDTIPGDFIKKYSQYGFTERLRDGKYEETGPEKERMREEVEMTVRLVRKKILPRVSSTG